MVVVVVHDEESGSIVRRSRVEESLSVGIVTSKDDGNVLQYGDDARLLPAHAK